MTNIPEPPIPSSLIETIASKLNCPGSPGCKACLENAKEIIAIIRQHEAKPGTVTTGDLRVAGGPAREHLVEQFKQKMLGYAKKHAEGLKAILSDEQASEIRDNRAEFETALLEAHPGTPLGMTNGLYNENSVEGAWRGWNLRKPEPVSISLRKNVADLQQDYFSYKERKAMLDYDTAEFIVKSVLDATGVQYVD